jgi:DNA polymerase-3 subunit gamma/tau
VVELVVAEREAILARHLTDDVHLVRFEPGRIELRPTDQAPRDLAGKLGRLLQERTGRRWLVSVSGEPGQPTLRRQRDEAEAKARDAALRDPLVQAVLETFPGAKLVARREKTDKGDDSA